MTTSSWGEIIDNRDAEHFIGREQELMLFHSEIKRDRPRYLIFFISGQGGVGKTELLKHYKEFSTNNEFVVAESDEQQGDIPSILHRFAEQIENKGHSLDKFSKKYMKYQELKQEIASDPNAPPELVSFIGQSIARVSLSLADEVPILRQGAKLIDQDTFSTQAGELAKYLAQKWSNKHDEIALLKNPAHILSLTFFNDLNGIANKNRILLCFDNFEITRRYLDSWFTSIRDYEPSSNIRLAVASRTSPGSTWEKLNN